MENMSALMETFLDKKLSDTEKSIKDHFDSRFDAIESRVRVLEDDRDRVNANMNDHVSQLSELRNEVNTLRAELKRTRSDLNGLEQHGRRWAVRIHGIKLPNDTRNEPGKQVAIDFLKTHLNLEIPIRDIDCAHRVGPITNGKQPLLVQFFGRDHVDTLINERKRLKGSGYIIYEDSTSAARKLINGLNNNNKLR